MQSTDSRQPTRLGFFVPVDLRERAERVAAADERSVSSLLRVALRREIERRERGEN